MRKWVTGTLAAWDLPDLGFVTELTAGELVTNALRYGRQPVRLRLIRDTELICEVSDADNTAPHLRRAHFRRGRPGPVHRRPAHPALGSNNSLESSDWGRNRLTDGSDQCHRCHGVHQQRNVARRRRIDRRDRPVAWVEAEVNPKSTRGLTEAGCL